mmetsp:Transcript_5263/g.6765  ORF Transcript_5263/g.6765 Transcript_5263/m.6765 type:complete len:193 (+) Transcript_5263:90-668(+)
MSFLSILTFLILSLSQLHFVSAEGTILSKTELSTFYADFDITAVYYDAPDACYEFEDDDLEDHGSKCPSGDDSAIPCGDVDSLRKWCEVTLGEDIVAAMQNVETNKAKNSIEGCIKFVGNHIKDLGHFACCETDPCYHFLDLELNKVDEELGYLDDDDDIGGGFASSGFVFVDDDDDEDDDGYNDSEIKDEF